MNIMGIVKPVVTLAASISVGTVVGNLIKATTPANLTKLQKVGVVVGTIVICDVLGDLVSKAAMDVLETAEESVEAVKETMVIIKGGTGDAADGDSADA